MLRVMQSQLSKVSVMTCAQVQLRTFTTTGILLANPRYYNPKVGMTVIKNASKNMQKLVAAELIKQQKETSRKGPKTAPKDPILYDNNRTKVFNRQFMENIGDVMLSIPDLLGHGLIITKVNVMADFSEVRVFWISSKSDQNSVANVLEANNSKIRTGMYSVSGLGKIPKISFVLDNNYLHMQQMEQLFKDLESRPGYVESPGNKENVWSYVANNVKLSSNGLGLDRDAILKKVTQDLEKSKALHRYQYNEEQFQSAYRETIQRHGLAQKQEVKSNIRKFLSNRKKKMKNSITEAGGEFSENV